jgi:hypothetical protein
MKNIKWILAIVCFLIMVSTSHAYDSYCVGKISYTFDTMDNTLAIDGPHECRQEMLFDGYWRAMNHFGQCVVVQYDYYLKPVVFRDIRTVQRYDRFIFSRSEQLKGG